MVVRSAGDQPHALTGKLVGHGGGVFHHLGLVGLKLIAERLLEAHGLAGDDVHQRPALGAGEHGAVDLLAKLLLAEDQRTPGAPQGLVGGGGDHMGIGHRAGVNACGHKARDMGHIHHQVCPYFISDLPHPLKVNKTGIGAGSGDNDLGPALLGPLQHLVVVNPLGLLVHAVEAGVEVLAGDGGLGAVGQVSAVVQVHAQDGVAGLKQGQVHGHIGLGAGVGLDIGVLGAEQLLGPVDGQIFDFIHIFTAAVVAGAGVALSIFIGQMAAHGLHHGGADKVLGGDKLDMVLLPAQLPHHGVVYLSVLLSDVVVAHIYSSVIICFLYCLPLRGICPEGPEGAVGRRQFILLYYTICHFSIGEKDDIMASLNVKRRSIR